VVDSLWKSHPHVLLAAEWARQRHPERNVVVPWPRDVGRAGAGEYNSIEAGDILFRSRVTPVGEWRIEVKRLPINFSARDGFKYQRILVCDVCKLEDARVRPKAVPLLSNDLRNVAVVNVPSDPRESGWAIRNTRNRHGVTTPTYFAPLDQAEFCPVDRAFHDQTARRLKIAELLARALILLPFLSFRPATVSPAAEAS